jgi:hypothetical protein
MANSKNYKAQKSEVETSNAKKMVTALIVTLCLTFCVLLQIYHFTYKQAGYDFYHLWIYGQEVSGSDVPDFYSNVFAQFVEGKYFQKALKNETDSRFRKAALWNAEMYEPGHLPDSTPLLYASLATICSGDYDRGLAIFQFVSTLIFCLTIYVIGRALGNSIPTVLIAISFIILFWSPFHSDTEVANLARIQSGILVACILICSYFNSRFAFIIGGALLGINVLLKPNIIGIPLSLAIIWFFRRRYHKLIFVMVGVFLGGLFAIGYSAFFYGSFSCWMSWFQILLDVQRNTGPIEANNLSLACLVEHYFGIDVSAAILLGFLSSLILCCWFATRKQIQARTNSASGELIGDLLGMGAGLIMVFMAFKVVWDHYFLLLAPVLLVLISLSEFQNQDSGKKRDTLIRVLSGVLFFIYALLPIRLLVPAASVYDIAITIGISSLIFWALLLFRLRQGLGVHR